ncbi:MAG: HEAT repeat domain-containing protein, partial [Chloroflexota bacterium]
RFEAILAIARHKSDPRLTKALVKILNGNQPALSVNAAWALARMGNEEAITSLRGGLNSPYRSVQDHSARALGTLGDQDVIPILMNRLESENDLGLQMAYGSALGKLQAQEAIPLLMQLLYQSNDPDLRMELALSLGRMLGDEHIFIRIMRSSRHEPGGATARVLMNVRKKWIQTIPALVPMLDDCIQSMSREDLSSGIYLLNLIIRSLPESAYQESARKILNECAERLGEFGFTRIEYPILALHVLSCE